MTYDDDDDGYIAGLREQITVLKAERDEAVRTRDQQKLLDLLARIHRDGGQYVAKYGVNQAISDADEAICGLIMKSDLTKYVILCEQNRSELARMHAGLSLRHAAELIGITRDELIQIEHAPSLDEFSVRTALGPVPIASKLAELYAVSVEWITGSVPRLDLHYVDQLVDNDGTISEHDRLVIAEFAAALPRKK